MYSTVASKGAKISSIENLTEPSFEYSCCGPPTDTAKPMFLPSSLYLFP